MFDGPLKPETPAQIAASVPRKAAHQAAEAALGTANARLAAISSEIRRLNSDPREMIEGNVDRQLAQLDGEERRIKNVTRPPLREAAVAARGERAVRVGEALRPLAAAAAARGHSAVLALQEALGGLAQVNHELRRAGGEPHLVPFADLAPLAARLAKLAGRG